MQIFLAVLLLSDVFILFCELALLTLYPTCHLVERDAISCCPVLDANATSTIATDLLDAVDNHQRWLTTNNESNHLPGDDHHDDDDHHYSCAAGLTAMLSLEATCDSHK